jgi:hypothetical protein
LKCWFSIVVFVLRRNSWRTTKLKGWFSIRRLVVFGGSGSRGTERIGGWSSGNVEHSLCYCQFLRSFAIKFLQKLFFAFLAFFGILLLGLDSIHTRQSWSLARSLGRIKLKLALLDGGDVVIVGNTNVVVVGLL